VKRDWDLVRKILFKLEELPAGETLDTDNFEGHEDQPEVVGYHIRIMRQAGFVEALDAGGGGAEYDVWMATGLTWDGQQFLDEIRADTTWNKVKSASISKGIPLTLEVVKALAKAELKRLTGLDLD
jgi:hypothetical protein